MLLRGDERVGTVVDLPWEQPDETHLDRARSTPGRVMLAGGLGPENVAAAIAAVRPWAVDSARSTESSPGIKDHDASCGRGSRRHDEPRSALTADGTSRRR